MTYRIVLDRELCSGFASCVGVAPDLFRLSDGRALALVELTDDERALEAAASCPMAAITIVEAKAA